MQETHRRKERCRTLSSCGILELHLSQSVPEIRSRLSDLVPRHRVLLDSLDRQLVIGDQVLQHRSLRAGNRGDVSLPSTTDSEARTSEIGAYGLVERTVTIVHRDTVLLQEVLLDQPRDVESNLVGFTERTLSDQLHDLGELVFLLENLLRRVSVVEEIGFGTFVVRLENSSAVRGHVWCQ